MSKKREDAFDLECKLSQDLETFKAAVKHHVSQGFNMAKSERAKTLLGSAIQQGKDPYVDFLLEMGVNPGRVPGLMEPLIREHKLIALERFLPYCKDYEPSISLPNNVDMVRLFMKNSCLSEQSQYAWGVENNRVAFVAALPKRSKFATMYVKDVKSTDMLAILMTKKGASLDECRLLHSTSSLDLARDLIVKYKITLKKQNTWNSRWTTPLADQLWAKNYEIAQLIYDHGGRIDRLSRLVQLLSTIPEDAERAKWIGLLFDHQKMDEPTSSVPGEKNLLHHCVEKGFLHSTIALLQRKVNVNVQMNWKNQAGLTALALLVNSQMVVLGPNGSVMSIWLIHYGSSLIGLRQGHFYHSGYEKLSIQSQRCIHLYAKLRTLTGDPHVIARVLKGTSYGDSMMIDDKQDKDTYVSGDRMEQEEDTRMCTLSFGDPIQEVLANVPVRSLLECDFIRDLLEGDDKEDQHPGFTLPNITRQQMEWVCAYTDNKTVDFLTKASMDELLGLVLATNYLLNDGLMQKAIEMINQQLNTCTTEYAMLQILGLSMLSPEDLHLCRRETDFLLPGLVASSKKQRLVGE